MMKALTFVLSSDSYASGGTRAHGKVLYGVQASNTTCMVGKFRWTNGVAEFWRRESPKGPKKTIGEGSAWRLRIQRARVSEEEWASWAIRSHLRDLVEEGYKVAPGNEQ